MNREDYERFAEKFEIRADGCWHWLACKDKDGYGHFGLSGKVPLAHRASYEHQYGKIPYPLELDHLCEQTECVNPCHLEAITRKEHLLRGRTFAAANQAKAHCLRGHELSGSNLVPYDLKRGARACRTCKREKDRLYQLSQPEQKGSIPERVPR